MSEVEEQWMEGKNRIEWLVRLIGKVMKKLCFKV